MAERFEYSDVTDHKYECFTGDYTRGFSFDLHWHYFMEILLIDSGEIELQVGSSMVNAVPGDVVVLLPSVMHSIKILSENATYTGIKFKPGSLYEDLDNSGIKWSELSLFKMAVSDKKVRSHFPAKTVKKTDLSYMMKMIKREMDSRAPGHLSNVNAAVRIILTDIIRIWQEEGLFPDNLDVNALESLSMEAVPAYIDEHISEVLRVEDLAEMCSLSYSGFAKKFCRMFGRSCKSYIELVRVRKAGQLLKDTSDDINTISQETGFSDASHMIRCFKKEYGTTPKKYRDS